LVEAMIRMMNNAVDWVGPVNIGNPDEFTMIELARSVIELTGSKSRIVHQPLPADDPRQRQPDIRQARERLDWMPTVALQQGLVQTIDYFRRLLDNGWFPAR
jgi:UDP-glucuronate decarboxylase